MTKVSFLPNILIYDMMILKEILDLIVLLVGIRIDMHIDLILVTDTYLARIIEITTYPDTLSL